MAWNYHDHATSIFRQGGPRTPDSGPPPNLTPGRRRLAEARGFTWCGLPLDQPLVRDDHVCARPPGHDGPCGPYSRLSKMQRSAADGVEAAARLAAKPPAPQPHPLALFLPQSAEELAEIIIAGRAPHIGWTGKDYDPIRCAVPCACVLCSLPRGRGWGVEELTRRITSMGREAHLSLMALACWALQGKRFSDDARRYCR